MALKHDNPSKPRFDRKTSHEQWAHAPYNFIPLPDRVVYAQEPLDHDRYHPDGVNGWIEIDIETCAPTYIRGMLTLAQYREQGQKKPDELTEDEKVQRAGFFATGSETADGLLAPVIPGSSLRGMMRQLVEIVGHGHMRWTAAEPTFTFRAMAAAKDDPLKLPYENALGRFGRNVQAGYLQWDGNHWYIHPALTPEKLNMPEKQLGYLKVKEKNIGSSDIPDFKRFNSSKYHPGWYPVSFSAESREGKRGRYVAVSQIGPREARYQHPGVLVCSGNMTETGGDSPRKNYALVLGPDRKAKPLRIPKQVIQDYRNGLTPFEETELEAWNKGKGKGCLPRPDELERDNEDNVITFSINNGAIVWGPPVFFIANGDEVRAFGHCPNFRIPAWLAAEDRAATPRDFIPEALRVGRDHPDLAEAIFGWVEDDGDGRQLTKQRAGRVYFGDARFVGADSEVWYQRNPIAPRILSGPKPTTFQHYLVQNRNAGHDPDDRVSLAHYGTLPSGTEVRGYKQYWHRGTRPPIEATADERKHESQLARIRPVNPGVRFNGHIYFENLQPEELGALLWVLTLPGGDHRHKIGMGKPLGMGAVRITPRLHCVDRQERYQGLFAGNQWQDGVSEAAPQSYLEKFEHFVIKGLAYDPERTSLGDLQRIQMLSEMLRWREGDEAWLEQTRYMEIEHGPRKINEYNARPVLPDPLFVGQQRVRQPRQEVNKSAQESVPAGYVRGRVKEFGNRGRAFGFITPDGGGDDVFVHQSQLPRGLNSLRQGQRVRFKVVRGPKGLQARDVQLDD